MGNDFAFRSTSTKLWAALHSHFSSKREGIYMGVPVFSYSQLVKATNGFDSSKELGDGGFKTVYHGKLCDGREVAVKRLYVHNCKRMEQFINEIEILTGLRHTSQVTPYGCPSRSSRELLTVYKYIRNKSGRFWAFGTFSE